MNRAYRDYCRHMGRWNMAAPMRSDWGYGTWDQSGFINFDRQGRMVHNNYYVTHGDHSKFYFYHEEEA